MSGIANPLLLVFRCGTEYVFVNTKTNKMIAVTLSAAAMNLFDRENVHADDLAREAAEWAQLAERPAAQVDMTDSDDLSEFCRYYFHDRLLARQAC